MKLHHPLIAAVATTTLLLSTGCAVVRDQQSVGTYIDDSVLTTRVKTKLAENAVLSTLTLTVETFKGVVQLSGVAKTAAERETAENIARDIAGVVAVRNDIRISG